MNDKPNDHDKDDKLYVRIFANDVKHIHKVGQILATPYSIQIWQILINSQEPMCPTMIAKTISDQNYEQERRNPTMANLLHHLDKMYEVGIVQYIEKSIHNQIRKFYTAVPSVVIVPPENYQKVIKSKTLRNIFKSISKFTSIVIVGFISMFLLQDDGGVDSGMWHMDLELSEYQIMIFFGIIMTGLIIERVYIHKKEKY